MIPISLRTRIALPNIVNRSYGESLSGYAWHNYKHNLTVRTATADSRCSSLDARPEQKFHKKLISDFCYLKLDLVTRDDDLSPHGRAERRTGYQHPHDTDRLTFECWFSSS
jgi:hypothetical protein